MKRLNTENINTPERYKELYFGPRRNEMRAREPLISLLRATIRGGRVLDLGCGFGQYLPYLKGDFVVGLDFSTEACIEAQANFPEAIIIEADFSKGLTLEQTDAYDTIFCSEVLEHMEDPARLIGEIRRVLCPGGTVIVTTPYRENILVDEHLWTFDEDDMRTLFAAFEDVGLFRYSGEGDLWEHFVVIARKGR